MGEEEKKADEQKAEGQPDEPEVGRVVGYFAKIGVAAIEVTAPEGGIAVGDTLHFKGHTTDFETTVESMQVENKPVEGAKAGDQVGIKVPDRVREHDKVYKR